MNLARDYRVSLTIDHDTPQVMEITGLSMAAHAHVGTDHAHCPPMIVRTSAVLHATEKLAPGAPMTADLRDDPKYWRFHAEEVLRVAECLEHEKSKIIMRRIADDYEYIAKLIERQRREREKK